MYGHPHCRLYTVLAPLFRNKSLRPVKRCPLLSKKTSHSSQYTILLRIVGVVFAWDLQHGRESRGIGVNAMSDSVGDMLIDEYDANIFAVLGESIKRGLDRSCISLAINNEKVLLSIGASSYVAYTREKQACYGVFVADDREELTVLVICLRGHLDGSGLVFARPSCWC